MSKEVLSPPKITLPDVGSMLDDKLRDTAIKFCNRVERSFVLDEGSKQNL